MLVLTPAFPAENWDDDFVFSHTSERDAPHKVHTLTEPRMSVTSSHFSEDWDAEGPSTTRPTISAVLGDKKSTSSAGLRSRLENWAEAGPSTPTKRSAAQEENWDDDFEDKTDSPIQRNPSSLKTRHAYHTPSRPKPPADLDNWDDDFENTDKNTPMCKRTRQDAYADSSDDDEDFGFADKEEDRTVTTRSRSLMLRQSPPPPVPALPQGVQNTIEPFPGSPTVSVFSIPTTSGRNSLGYMSTSHLALRPSVSGVSLAMLPPSPPIHRERRRLRKKSRPPHLDTNVFELVEEQRDSTPPLPPSTPESSSPPLPSAIEATPSSNKTPLLSRIGSVKKWGVRRKRASTGPAEVMVHELGGRAEENTPRPPSTFVPPTAEPPASTVNSNSINNRTGWFFRPGGAPGSGSPPPPPPAAELKREKSLDKFRVTSGSGPGTGAPVPSTPSRKLSRRKPSRMFDPSSSNELAQASPAKPSLSATARRPTSMQVPNGKLPPGISPSTGTRHASYGSSVGRASARVFSTPTPTESMEDLDLQPPEGSRGLMGSVRKISLVGGKKHKKKKSIADISASLGRTTQAPTAPASSTAVPRRNSLGDLKIPARISQAQIGLKRDLGMVREFAASVDKLKELQTTYQQLLSEANARLESAPPSRATSPTILNLTRTRSRLRSNTNPNSTFSDHKQFSASLNAIAHKYKISWECAELLIELGSGSQPASVATPANMPSPPTQAEGDIRKGRERAITLSGEESKHPTSLSRTSSPNPSWRASTGRHDLSHRQLVLLRDMLNNVDLVPDDVPSAEDTGANRHWRWADAMCSSVTLPSEDSVAGSTDGKKRRMSRMGMSGLRDMLRMLKRSHSEQPPPPPLPPLPPPVPASTTSLSTESSMGSHSQHHYTLAQVPRRGSKTSTGPDSVRSVRDQPNSPYSGPPLNHKASPRRPSLASIFRLGQKNKSASSTADSSQDGHSDIRSASRGSNVTGEDDWDRIDSAVDLDIPVRSLAADGTATIKGKKSRPQYLPVQTHSRRPVTPIRGPESPQVSFKVEASPRSIRPVRSIRLSNVEEVEDDQRQPRPRSRAGNKSPLPRTSPRRPPSRGQPTAAMMGKSSSVRSAPPPQPLDGDVQVPDFKLSMTPENIKPLLENAKEVHARLNECIKEMRVLLDKYKPFPL
ncbi:hypothetical protein ID866_3003 [Astraeus odoratus]|nr:hypothetical protein ID866_3003 [Astraeus odoratus]